MIREKPVYDAINATYNVLDEPLRNLTIKQDPNPDLTVKLHENTYMFSGFKTKIMAEEAATLLRDEKGNIKSFDKFYQDVRGIDDKYNKKYLSSEYAHAVSSTQAAREWAGFAEGAGRYNLQYRTANDGNVRREHQALNDITLPFDDQFWNHYMPPNGWRCRCRVIEVRKSKYEVSDSEKAMRIGDKMTEDKKMQMFRYNPGKEGRVFPQKHPYFPKGCGDCNKANLAFESNREQCRACVEIKRCYDAFNRGKREKSYSIEEKRKVYALPVEKQFDVIRSESNNLQILRHKLVHPSRSDYSRVQAAGFAYAKNHKTVELMPEVYVSEHDARKKLGLNKITGNPDLRVDNKFIDVKSPFTARRILANANSASKQGAIVCITDDFIVITKEEAEQKSENIFRNDNYLPDEVHFMIDGNIVKYKRSE